MIHSKSFLGNLAALITILIWGTTFISTKVLLLSFTPIEILLIRFVVGYAALWLIHPHVFKIRPFRQEALLLLAGLSGVTLYYLFENIALTYTFASNVGIIISASPFCTALLAHFLLDGEKLKLPFFVGFLMAILGISLIDLNGSYVLKLNPLGDLLAVFAAIIWAVYSILMRKISKNHYDVIECTRRIFFYGIVFMLPVAFVTGIHISIKTMLNGINLFNLLFLGLGASALCFVTWNLAVGILGAVKTSIYIYLVPVITITASAILLSERITWLEVTGMGLTVTGLFISMLKNRKKQV